MTTKHKEWKEYIKGYNILKVGCQGKNGIQTEINLTIQKMNLKTSKRTGKKSN